MTPPRTLFIDIETSPNLAYVWDLWKQDVGLNQIEDVSEVLCFAAKWAGDRKTMFWRREFEMIERAHELLSEADVVVHYNGTRFDIPHLNREFLLYGLAPPAPFLQVDLWKAVKQKFNFVSNKLDHVAQQLGLGSKTKHQGFGLWKDCLRDDPKAWALMEKYNRQDVVLTEKLYHELLPWIPGMPSVFAEPGTCPTCGSNKLQKRGFAHTRTSKYQRFQCLGCGTWSRDTRRTSGASLTQATL